MDIYIQGTSPGLDTQLGVFLGSVHQAGFIQAGYIQAGYIIYPYV